MVFQKGETESQGEGANNGTDATPSQANNIAEKGLIPKGGKAIKPGWLNHYGDKAPTLFPQTYTVSVGQLACIFGSISCLSKYMYFNIRSLERKFRVHFYCV